MAKGSRRHKKSTCKIPKSKVQDASFAGEEDLDDEIDAFHKQRDMIPLDIKADDTYVDEMEQPVFDFESGGFEEDADDGDEDNDRKDNDISCDDGNEENVDRLPRFAAKIARQAKLLRQQIGGVDDDIHDDGDEPEEERKTVWGQHKNMYFNADNIDFELLSSDEDLLEEEKEALRMQRLKAKSFSLADYGLEVDDEDGHVFDEKGKSLEDMLSVSKVITKAGAGGPDEYMHENHFKVEKDLNALSAKEKMDIVYSSAPELVGLLSELNGALNHLKRVKHLLCKGKECVPEGGMHYLEVKQQLLLTYCQAIGFYLLMKSEGCPVRDHPVIALLVEVKKLFEKVKKIDDKIPSQIEDYLNYDSGNALLDLERVISENVCPELKSDIPGRSNDACQVAVVGDLGKVLENTIQKDQCDQLGVQRREMLKVRASLEEKLRQKGIYNDMKKQPDKCLNHASQQKKRPRNSADFDDEVAETVINGRMSLFQPTKLSKLVANKLNKPTVVSGEDDLPNRDDIGERRRKHELKVIARVGAGLMNDDDGADELADVGVDDMNGNEVSGESEDDFYKEAKHQRDSKRLAKTELHLRASALPSPPETDKTNGRRHITYEMEKNKGLTRTRKKLTKIPRKKYKMKHQKAVIRRKGQVRDIRRPTGPYGGEITGINTNISRSIRFKN